MLVHSIAAADEPAVDFNRDVAPIFERHCIRCHQASHREGELSLATADDLVASAYVVPKKPGDSYLLDVVTAKADDRPMMPKEGATLSKAELDMLRTWVEHGAVWPKDTVVRERAKADKDWWSLRPLARLEPPTLPDDAAQFAGDWSAHPIDRFVAAALVDKGLEPSAPADKRALLRRATFDLTGLPPTPEEIEAFEADDASDAFERVVDRLLESPRYGERWGRHWLDVVRFGESRGYERNQIIDNLWPFRDYVIGSFNADKPFDQFIREHLAGDLIGKDRPDMEVGAAFLVAGPYDDVGNKNPVAAAQIRADTIDEIIRSTGEAFLGMTVGCARCHNHKFDPIAQRDYYSLYATFAAVHHAAREVATPEARAERAARLKPLEAERAAIAADRAKLTAVLDERAKAHEAEGAKSWTRPRHSHYETIEEFAPVRARYVRLRFEGTDAANDPKREARLDEFEVWTAGKKPHNVALAAAGAKAEGTTKRKATDFARVYNVEVVNDGRYDQKWFVGGDRLTITLAKPQRVAKVVFSSDRVRGLAADSTQSTFVGDYWIEVSNDGQGWTEVAKSLDRVPPTDAVKQRRLLKLVTTADEARQLAEFDKQLAAVDRKIANVPALPDWWVGRTLKAPGPFHVFQGGDPQKPGEKVAAHSLAVLDERVPPYSLADDATPAARRIALADWLVRPTHPLVPRVLANRVWHYHFGRGLVDTPSDFGYMGTKPSHPELLDWLAGELVRGGWRLKPLHRLIMTSQAYRQASAARDDALAVDGDNRLLWRFSPRRLSAEELRDTMLDISGKLDERMGGPGFRLYDYKQDNVATYVPLDRHGPETYRRAVYHQNARASRVDLVSDFDCPDNAFSAPRRSATTTPLQALTLLNHSFTFDMAEAWAARLAQERPGDTAAQIDRAWRQAYGRAATSDELTAAQRLVASHGLRALCRALFNTNELLYVR
ncbi:MAG TPA: DUF1553 domain-containing protein [Pirellulales bacterium]|nr:DUF1553 domain-containing protein [Pirellulales bacterium]